MSADLSAAGHRLSLALQLGGCAVEVLRDRPPVLLAKYFTPGGPNQALCGFLDEQRPSNEAVQSYSARLQEVDQLPMLTQRVLFLQCAPGDLPAGPQDVRVVAFTTLVESILTQTGYRRKLSAALRERLDEDEELLPIECSSRVGLTQPGAQLSADRALEGFLTSDAERLCCVVGSFGSGKSILLHTFALQLLEHGHYCYPVLVDVGGIGGRQIPGVVDRYISDLFGIPSWNLANLATVLEGIHEPIVLLDSVDEQTDLDPKDILRVLDYVVTLAAEGRKIVVAFRPEIFQSQDEYQRLLLQPVAEAGYGWRVIRPSQLPSAAIEARLGKHFAGLPTSLSAEVQELAEQLAERPIWLRSVLRWSLPANTSSEMQTIHLVEHCIREWSRRELFTRRPLLEQGQRDILTTLIAFSLHSGLGLQASAHGKVHRRELTSFVRRIIPKLQDMESDIQDYVRWLELPADLAAESVAVANLFTLDEEGLLEFADSVFFLYYLAQAYAAALEKKPSHWLSQQVILELFGVNTVEDLLGLSVAPTDSLFRSVFRQMLKYRGVDVEDHLTRIVSRLVPAGPVRHREVSELLVRFHAAESEEAQPYELAVPAHWPTRGAWHAAANVASLLQAWRQQRDALTGFDFSFVSFNGCDLSGITFRDCRFVGADFSYCRLDETRFEACDMSYSLFHKIRASPELLLGKSNSIDNAILLGGPVLAEDEELDAAASLEALRGEGEMWIIPEGPIAAPENQGFPVEVGLFLVDKAPITNAAFGAFLEKAPHFSPSVHAFEVEQPYYLAYYDQATRRPGCEDLPVVYVTLIAAVGYAVSQGKRLPSIAEYLAYGKNLGSRPPEQRWDEYWAMPPVEQSTNYGVGYVTEWTSQVDDEDYWQSVMMSMGAGQEQRKICPFPSYRREAGRHCEYLIAGSSYLRKAIERKNSKPGTWVNPDQGFRCVLDYRAAVNRHLRLRAASSRTTPATTGQ